MILMMAACRQQAAPEITPTPTLAVEASTSVPTTTAIERATLPPTWTPALSYTPSITVTPSITLTPSRTPSLTLTPSPTLTFTVTYTPSPNATDFALLSQPLTPECANFGLDTTTTSSQFKLGAPATVGWTSVSTAAIYIVRLYDANQVTLVTDKTTDTTYTFSAAQIPTVETYAWTVAPLDGDGVQICPSRGGLLRVTP